MTGRIRRPIVTLCNYWINYPIRRRIVCRTAKGILSARDRWNKKAATPDRTFFHQRLGHWRHFAYWRHLRLELTTIAISDARVCWKNPDWRWIVRLHFLKCEFWTFWKSWCCHPGSHRLLKPGGFTAHQIDLRDHIDFEKPLEFLKVSGADYKFTSPYGTNRWRRSDFESAFRAAGFRQVDIRISESHQISDSGIFFIWSLFREALSARGTGDRRDQGLCDEIVC